MPGVLLAKSLKWLHSLETRLGKTCRLGKRIPLRLVRAPPEPSSEDVHPRKCRKVEAMA